MTSRRRALALFTFGIISFSLCSRPLPASAQGLGDADFDGDVDNFDLMIILDNQGLIGVMADVDGDFDTDADDYELAKTNFDSSMSFAGALSAPPADANSAKLIYNANTGALLLDQTNAPGGVLSAFLLQSSAAFNAVNPIAYPFSTTPQNYATRTSSLLAQADPDAATSPPGLPANPHNLGNLLAPGLTLAGLEGLSVRGVYTGQISNQPAGAHVRSFQLVVVPEPAVLAPALAAAIAAICAIRLRSRCQFLR